MKGKPGDGQQDNDQHGSSSPQEGNRPNEHKSDSADNPAPKSSENSSDNAKSPSNSPKESDSHGSQGGDRAGGGKSGPGQSANKAGTGGAGQHTAADEGQGKSQGHGKGEDSAKPGADKQSNKATGHAGHQRGNGSQVGDKAARKGSPAKQSGDKQGPGGSDSGSGGNRTGPLPDGVTPQDHSLKGDAANMDFAKKQFDLALDHLKKGNPKLLKELNWTPDDARKLAARLEQMKAAAKTAGPEGDRARRNLDNLYRDLGARAEQVNRFADHSATDAQRGVLESRDSGPPADYLDQVEAYQQGTLQGGK